MRSIKYKDLYCAFKFQHFSGGNYFMELLSMLKTGEIEGKSFLNHTVPALHSACALSLCSLIQIAMEEMVDSFKLGLDACMK